MAITPFARISKIGAASRWESGLNQRSAFKRKRSSVRPSSAEKRQLAKALLRVVLKNW